MDTVLTWFARGWAALVLFANLVAVIGFIVGAPTLREGLTRIADTYSPFNLINLAVEVVVLSPAIAVVYWRDRRRARIHLTERSRDSEAND
jgi:hypothetical protein